MFCSKCGTRINESMKFCSNCGVRLGGPTQATSIAATSEKASADAPSPTSSGKRDGTSKVAFAAGGMAIVALVAALYFGTDLLRPALPETPSIEPEPTAKPVEPVQDKPAEIAKSDGVPAESDSNSPLRSTPPEEPSASVDAPKTKPEVTARSTPQTEQKAPARKQQSTPGDLGSAKSRSKRGPTAPTTTPSVPFNPGTYQTVRPTTVFEQPSGSSRVVANIGGGININVVGSKGDWLEVHSRIGNPPGFIRRDDAKPVE